MFFFADYVCGGMIGVGEEANWEISVLMNALEVSLFCFSEEKRKWNNIHAFIDYEGPTQERPEAFSMQTVQPALDLSSSQRLY